MMASQNTRMRQAMQKGIRGLDRRTDDIRALFGHVDQVAT